MKAGHPMITMKRLGIFAAVVALAACGSDGEPVVGSAEQIAAAPAEPAGPTPGDLEFERITGAWSDEVFERCGRGLREVLGTRDLVTGALDGVRDPQGKATAEIEDARYWLELGDEEFSRVRPKLEEGICDPEATVAFDQVVQYYIKAGTAAVQAGQVAGT